MKLKKVGYHITKGKCVKVYLMKKKNRNGKLVTKRVNYKGKKIKKGTKIYKRKADCLKALKKMKQKKSKRSKSKKPVKKTNLKSKFGKKSSCTYALPYFGNMVPSISKTWSGTNDTTISSSNWKWPSPGAKSIDMQQGVWLKH